MTDCFVCRGNVASGESHHIVPRSRGGTDGPEIHLCANCHLTVHNAARRMRSGKSVDATLAYLSESARDRMLGLVQVILMADLEGVTNPKPLLTVMLDDPSYLEALNRSKIDGGFTSQSATINAILRGIALQYGLIDSRATDAPRKVPIADLN